MNHLGVSFPSDELHKDITAPELHLLRMPPMIEMFRLSTFSTKTVTFETLIKEIIVCLYSKFH
uniref:Uncharacterized protein n=1 Tax=Arion vulgaris TaxID=1028688 RepID=A0A0B6ZVP5_9EUPU